MLRYHFSHRRDTRYLVDDPGIPTLQEAVTAFEHGGNASLPIHAGGSYDFAGDPPTIEDIENLQTQNDEDIMDAAASLYREKAEQAALRRLESSRIKEKQEQQPSESSNQNDNPGGAQ